MNTRKRIIIMAASFLCACVVGAIVGLLIFSPPKQENNPIALEINTGLLNIAYQCKIAISAIKEEIEFSFALLNRSDRASASDIDALNEQLEEITKLNFELGELNSELTSFVNNDSIHSILTDKVLAEINSVLLDINDIQNTKVKNIIKELNIAIATGSSI
jgi:predicted nucleotidyltransferase